MKNRYGVDGVMIGRAAIGQPWIFREIKHFLATGTELPPATLEERVSFCREHLLQSIAWKGPVLGILEMRRHYTNYFKGIPNIKHYRNLLVTMDGMEELEAVLIDISRMEMEVVG